jgi:hypothetical protein
MSGAKPPDAAGDAGAGLPKDSWKPRGFCGCTDQDPAITAKKTTAMAGAIAVVEKSA